MEDGWIKRPEGWEENNIIYKTSNNLKTYDVIIVLAGGLTDSGEVHPWVMRRLDKAIQIYNQRNTPILCCGGGTYHKPPFVNEKGFAIHESTECANYLIQHNVNPNHIYKEWSSYDTIANGFFSLANHVIWRKWKNIVLITSEFHMPRSRKIFEWIYSLHTAKQYNFTFESVSDAGLDDDLIENRVKREKKSLQNIIKLSNEIKTMEDFHKWLYTKHNAYNNSKRTSSNIKCLKSY